MKKIIGLFLAFLLLVSPAGAFMYDVKVLSNDEISKLSDDALISAYIDVLVEFEAASSFHQTSGFTPKDYEKHKDLLRYKIYLTREIEKRKLALPHLEDK